jgi:surface antigen
MQKIYKTNKRFLKFILPGLGAAAITGMLIPTQSVAAADDAGKKMAVYTLNSSDPYAADTLKTKVISKLADSNSSIDLNNVDIDNSQVSVSGLNMNKPGIQAVTIKVGLTQLGDSAKTLGYSVTETATINVVKTSAPVLKLKKSTVVVNNGDVWNPSSYISTISDDSGTLPVLKETDNVNMSEDGDYYASYTVVNAEGISTSAVLNVKVKTPQEVLDAQDSATQAAKKAEEEKQAAATQAAQQAALAAANAASSSSGKVYGVSGLNPYSGGWSNCVAGAWEAVYENLGISLPNFGSAWDWLGNASADGYATGMTPTVGSVAVYTHHVAYVDQVSADGSAVHIIEGNYDGHYNERWVSATGEGSQATTGYIYVK